MATQIIDQYTEGDTIPPLKRTAPKTIANLTGFTIRLRINRERTGQLVKTITETVGPDGQITDAVKKEFQFTFVAADLVAGLQQKAELEYDDGSGGIQTEQPLLFSVAEPLD